ncbi:AzlC family ABC transporter permease [Streptomyces sp. CA2R101]|uniref:AzlC family ABC transporter permease n=1 Tax=Streptomyces sp. CA2R101 TaxID=3120152 RepID=UPI003008B879
MSSHMRTARGEPAPPQDRKRASDIRLALAETLPVGVGMFSLGITFGLLVVQSGLAWWWTPLFSGLIYAGSLEFLLVGMLMAASPLVSIALTTLLVNFRHVFYSLSFPLHRVRGKVAKTYAVFALIDEAYALTATRPADSFSSLRIIATQVSLQSYWVGGGLVGALTGRALPTIDGLDFTLTSLFTVLAIEACRSGRDLPAPLLAAGCGLFAQLVAPGQMLVVAMTLYVLALLVRYRFTRPQEHTNA